MEAVLPKYFENILYILQKLPKERGEEGRKTSLVCYTENIVLVILIDSSYQFSAVLVDFTDK